MTEEWKPIVGWEGLYEVSNLGRVQGVTRSIPMRDGRTYTKTAKVLTPQWGRGYAMVKLRKPGVQQAIRIHREVLKAFVGPCPAGMEACHNNDVREDNRLENLRWDTKTANKIDAVSNGRNQQTNKTKCPQGHDYSKENTMTWINPASGRPARRCRECDRARHRRLDGDDK